MKISCSPSHVVGKYLTTDGEFFAHAPDQDTVDLVAMRFAWNIHVPSMDIYAPSSIVHKCDHVPVRKAESILDSTLIR